MDFTIAQRGRALIDFEVALRQATNRLQQTVEGELAQAGLTADTLPDDMNDRHAVIDDCLANSKAYRARRLLGEWSAAAHGPACEEAFAEIRDEVVPELDRLREGPTTLEVEPDFEPPAYWSKVWFHRTTGGWDASDYNGFVHSEFVHKRFVSRVFPGDIYGQRRRLLGELSKPRYDRIAEFGTSSGHYTLAIAEAFPDAQIWGVDLSRRMLEQAQRVANEHGYAWRLFVRPGEDTRFESGSYDVVTSFATHHELPPRIIQRCFEEAFRILMPGGELLMSDVPRYADLDRLAAWRFDWVAKWGGEPYWRASAMLDFAEGARAAGFVDVRTGGFPSSRDPYFVYGRKPDA